MKSKGKAIDFSGQNIYVGLDVHLKSWKVTIMIEERFHKTFSQDADASILRAYLCKHFPGATYHSVYEAGFCGFSVHRQLMSEGLRNLVVNPADVPTTDKEKTQKEDKRDSRKLARSLKSGELSGIYVPEKGMEELRSLVRYRKTLVKEITRHKCRIKSYLYFQGIKIPAEMSNAGKHWSSKFSKWLKEEVRLETIHGKMVLDELVDTAELLRQKLLKVNRLLRRLGIEGEYCHRLQLLQSIPGIGLVGSMTLLSELDDIFRFKKLDYLCSYVGLVPSTNSSGEKEKTGKITRRSNRFLREIIVEAAWTASRLDPDLAQSFAILSKRMSSNEAIIRIAKKLLNRIRYVLKNEVAYVHSIR